MGEDSEIRVLIGPENIAEELKDSSVVIASYDAGDNTRGLIGCLGSYLLPLLVMIFTFILAVLLQ